jgi:gliding motility-associated-like protein
MKKTILFICLFLSYTICLAQDDLIITQPADAVICANTPADFNIATVNAANVTYKWQYFDVNNWTDLSDGTVYSGCSSPNLHISNTAGLNDIQYRCMVMKDEQTEISQPVNLLIQPDLIEVVSQPLNISLFPGTDATFSILANSSQASYQWERNTGTGWILLPQETSRKLTILNAAGSMDGYLYRCKLSNICSAVPVYSEAAALYVKLVINIPNESTAACENQLGIIEITTPQNENTAYQWQVLKGDWTDISNDQTYTGSKTTRLQLLASSTLNQAKYRCTATSIGRMDISPTVTLNVNQPVSILSQPENITLDHAGPAFFSVAVSGSSPAYQWQVNSGGQGWTNIPNATGATYELPDVTADMSGNLYRCSITNTCTAGALSDIVTLQLMPEIKSQPVSTPVCENSKTILQVNATNASGFEWQVFILNQVWVKLTDNAFYSGTSTGSLEITATTDLQNLQYRCKVSNGNGAVYSSPAMLTVKPGIAITAHPQNKTVFPGDHVTFQVDVTGTAVNYQWQQETSEGWLDIAGAVSNSIFMTNINETMKNSKFRCRISGECTNSVFSNAAILKITGRNIPNIITPYQPTHNTWNLTLLDNYPNCQVYIYNSIGKRVFYSKGYTEPWAGTYQGNILPTGIYTYYIDLGDFSSPLRGKLVIQK